MSTKKVARSKSKLKLRFEIKKGEVFKALDKNEFPLLRGLQFSNFGRIISFKNYPGGRLITGTKVKGYPKLTLRDDKDVAHSVLVHHVIAKAFLKTPKKKKTHLIHLDYVKDNNHADNLKWVSDKKFSLHLSSNPKLTNRTKEELITNKKLNPAKVKEIKILLKKKNAVPSKIATKYKISHTQINRIKSGENWSHIKA